MLNFGPFEELMKSRVTIAFQEGLQVATPIQYKSIGVIPEMDGDLWKGVSVEVEHKDNATPFGIVEKARAAVRDLLTLVWVGRGLEDPLGAIQIRLLSPSVPGKDIGIAGTQLDALICRQLVAMPDEDLVTRLSVDLQLRRQAEALNAAKANGDVISRIRWAYMVLEQEKERKQGYQVPDDFRYIRNGVSHPELKQNSDKAYFQKELGVDFPDLTNPAHIKFLEQKSMDLLKEAVQIVEGRLADHKFWQ
jgi:hypothetical protein